MSNNIVLKNFYKKYCRILTRTIQLAKKLHDSELISQSGNETKTAWTLIKPLTDKRTNSSEDPTLNIVGKLMKNPQVIAKTFNNYFFNIVEESVTKIIKHENSDRIKHPYMQHTVNAFQQPLSPIELEPVTEKGNYEIIKSLKRKASYGYDEVWLWIVKLSVPFISSPLIYICNNLLSTGTFPTWL
jgi:hypothetical protein